MERYIKDARLQMFLEDANHMINDSYRTDACLHYPPHTIAIAVIVMVAIWNKDHLEHPGWESWFESLQFHDNHKAQIKEVQDLLLLLYDEHAQLEQTEIDKIMDRIPKHELISQPSASTAPLPANAS